MVKLICIHRSGRTVHNGWKAPQKPSLELMTSTKVCTFLRAVGTAPTAREADNIWNPAQAPTTTVKRLQKTSPKPPKGRGGNWGGRSRGGNCGGGGYRSRRGGYRGRGGLSRGPTIVNTGIHYHSW